MSYNKCYNCKYLKIEMYNTGYCRSPQNVKYYIDLESGSKQQSIIKPLSEIQNNDGTCGYSPNFSKKVSNIFTNLRIKYYKWREPELFF